ncbi:response regulator [Kordiimonas sp. SCSIO 12603]|uniref:response regulator n=1 Tax=Kordiimonas sp. SCSIO 12603 TaxID=2829596 RepID=UPI002103A432|nr:response regulator [Kordiimonas sp. SCSIO 12603]UTW60170.1 response regulator [Kordiimonas sp. SCSIO 12603]
MKPSILFVDDERDVLRGLRRALRGKRKDWDMRFVESAQEAMIAMSETPANIIVSDMRMPDVDGAGLMESLAENWPFTCRFILSGQAADHAVIKAVGITHQFLAKPFDSQKLIKLLEEQIPLFETEQSSRPLAIEALPTPDSTAEKINRIFEQPDFDANELAEIIGDDLALSAKLLQLSNSAYFGNGHTTLLPGDAVRTLGREVLTTLKDQTRFMEPASATCPNHKELNDLLHMAGEYSRMADAYCHNFPEHELDPALLRQLAKFLPLGRVLGIASGAKSYLDETLCINFANLWGFPQEIVSGLKEIWTSNISTDEAAVAAAIGQFFQHEGVPADQQNPAIASFIERLQNLSIQEEKAA